VFGALETAAPAADPDAGAPRLRRNAPDLLLELGLTKWGAGPFSPDLGAYIQILPRAFDAVGYDPSALGPLAKATVLFGTWAEFILPALVVLGLFTRIAALGMIGFVIVLTWVDIMGHGAGPETIGAWFNNTSGDAILDQRAFWLFLMIVLVLRGAGPAVDRRADLAALQKRRLHRRVPAEVKPPLAFLDHRPFHQRGMGRQEIEGRLCALRLRQAAPGRGPRVHQPVAEGLQEPRPRGVVQRRLADVDQNRLAPRVFQAPNRLPAGIAVAQSVDFHDLAHSVASFFNHLRKLAPSCPCASD
jgi:putative oxidoreductase